MIHLTHLKKTAANAHQIGLRLMLREITTIAATGVPARQRLAGPCWRDPHGCQRLIRRSDWAFGQAMPSAECHRRLHHAAAGCG